MGRFSDYQTSRHLKDGAYESNIRAFSGLKKDAKYRRPVIAEGPYEGLPAFADYRSYFMEFFYDFTRKTDYDATNEWTRTQEAGTGEAALDDDALLGTLTITNSAADNDRTHIQYTAGVAGEFIQLAANKILIYETRIQLNNATESDAFVGLCITDTTLGATAVPTASDYVGFAKDDGDANVDFVSAKNSTETEKAAITTVANTTYKTLAFRADGISSIQPWYKDSTTGLWVRKPVVTTNICDDEQLCMTFHIVNGEAVARSLKMDYVRVLLER